ncbi:MAG: hypothetical protein LC135_08925 [Phycisphaerae bacterium]|nr:hypothetical protein [Phycisphaerae bacterium]MCZ2399974.1 hypothetical protein [Phycisphaerae bacterium]NUN47490.1 hypothetical protein [Candidatus Brocadiia bacterium]
MVTRFAALIVAVAVLVVAVGCAPNFGPNAKNGIVFYCPGASNTDLGDVPIRKGLQDAGFRGEVNVFYWSLAPVPIVGVAIDQYAKYARLRAGTLARDIEAYIDRFPGRPVTVIGLSAGTGVALWAVGELRHGYEVDNVVLLSSSLSSTFDASWALQRVRGRVYVFYSPNDAVLSGPMRFAGTIDGSFTDEPVGLVGLRSPDPAGKIQNIPYSAEFASYGYYGGHTDSTASGFIRAVVAPKIIRPDVSFARPETAAPSRLASTPPLGPRR